jgi:hypothetical protein
LPVLETNKSLAWMYLLGPFIAVIVIPHCCLACMFFTLNDIRTVCVRISWQ